MKITETCSCGASFEMDAIPIQYLRHERGSDYIKAATVTEIAAVMDRWRESHHHDPAPAGVSAAPTSRDNHAEDPAGAPIPTTSEPTCDTCHRLLSRVGTCPKGCEQ